MARRSAGLASNAAQEPRISVRESPEHRKSEAMQWPDFIVSPTVVAMTTASPPATKTMAAHSPAFNKSLLQNSEGQQSRSESPDGPVHLTRKDAFVRMPGPRPNGSDAVTQAVHSSEFWMKGVAAGRPLPEEKEIHSDKSGPGSVRRSTASRRSGAVTSTHSQHSQSSFTLLEIAKPVPMWSPRAAITLDMLSGKQGALLPPRTMFRPRTIALIKPSDVCRVGDASFPAAQASGSPKVAVTRGVVPSDGNSSSKPRTSSRLVKPLSPLNTAPLTPQHKGKLTVHAARMIAAGKTQSSELLSPMSRRKAAAAAKARMQATCCSVIWSDLKAWWRRSEERQRLVYRLIRSAEFEDGPVGHIVRLCGLLPKHLAKFAEVFHEDLVTDERKRVNSASFLDWIEVPNNVFDRCLFRVIERTLTLSGKMQSFADFLVAIITLCLFTQEDLMRFLFNAFDVDDSGAIDETEFRAMLITMSSDDTPFPGTFRKLLDTADANGDGLLQFEEFRDLAKRFPMSMFPLFNFQVRLKEATLGQEKWGSIKFRVDEALDFMAAEKRALATMY